MFVYGLMHVVVFVYACQYVSLLAFHYASSASSTASSSTTSTTSLFHLSLVHLLLSLSLALLLVC